MSKIAYKSIRLKKSSMQIVEQANARKSRSTLPQGSAKRLSDMQAPIRPHTETQMCSLRKAHEAWRQVDRH